MSGGVGGKSYGYNKKRSSVIEDEDDADLLEGEEDMDWDQAQVRLEDFFPSLIGVRASRLDVNRG